MTVNTLINNWEKNRTTFQAETGLEDEKWVKSRQQIEIGEEKKSLAWLIRVCQLAKVLAQNQMEGAQ